MNDAVTILVVEDDQLIQAMVEEALSEGGFASALTASGEEAITLLQDDKSKYWLVKLMITWWESSMDGRSVVLPGRLIRRCPSST